MAHWWKTNLSLNLYSVKTNILCKIFFFFENISDVNIYFLHNYMIFSSIYSMYYFACYRIILFEDVLFPAGWFALLLIELMVGISEFDIRTRSTGWNDVQLKIFTLKSQRNVARHIVHKSSSFTNHCTPHEPCITHYLTALLESVTRPSAFSRQERYLSMRTEKSR